MLCLLTSIAGDQIIYTGALCVCFGYRGGYNKWYQSNLVLFGVGIGTELIGQGEGQSGRQCLVRSLPALI